VFIEVHVAQPLFFCVLLCKSLFVFFVLAIILSVFLRFAVSDYPCVSLNFSSLIKYKVFLFSHEHYIIILNITSEITSPIQNFLGAAVS